MTKQKMTPSEALVETLVAEGVKTVFGTGGFQELDQMAWFKDLKFTDVRQHLAALSWGNCGFAYGAALGAKIGRPKVPVFAFQGDGTYGISGLAEVMTAVRENIPVIAVVANNHEWGAEKKNQIDYYDNRFVGANLPDNPDYARLAEDMGAKGFRVEDYRDGPEVVREAVKSSRPCVINALIEGGEKVLAEPFRRDALKKTDTPSA
jgi:sulfoacetaldehyde acetyltransferase